MVMIKHVYVGSMENTKGHDGLDAKDAQREVARRALAPDPDLRGGAVSDFGVSVDFTLVQNMDLDHQARGAVDQKK